VKPLPRWFRALIAGIGTLMPPIGASIAWRLFWQLGTPSRVRELELQVHETALRRDIDIAGKTVGTYEWGAGPAVLLVHGWRSRASRFAALTTQLVDHGYLVVAFDAPGNGASTGNRTDAFEYIEAIRALEARYGEFEAVVAHSFGALAALMAKRAGLRTRRIVTVAGVHDFDSIVTTFTQAIGLPKLATRLLRSRIERRIGPPGFDIWREAVAELDPTDTSTPILVVHDEDDAEVSIDQAMLIAEAHTGPFATLITTGLGHNRILSDPRVIGRIVEFINAPTADADADAARPIPRDATGNTK
jgi:pimeloyl-ACP methyl ester carboxylesterase